MLAALAGVAETVVIVVHGEYGLFETATGAELWLAIAPNLVWLAAGLIGWALRPASPIGRLMTALALPYFTPTILRLTGEPLLFTLGLLLWTLPLSLAAHLCLVFPEGRAESSTERRLIATSYLVNVFPFTWALFLDPAASQACVHCPGNLLLLEPDPAAADAVVGIGGVCVAVTGTAIAVVMARRWRAATPTARRALTPVLGALLVSAVLIVPAFVIAPDEGVWDSQPGAAAWLVSGLVPLAFLLGLLQTRLQRAGVADLVVELSTAPEPSRVRELLARALGDPSVELAFWRPETGSYVDPDGRPVALPRAEGPRAVSVIEGDGIRLGALVHDNSLLQSRALLDGVTAAARLALENARLQAELRAQLREVRESRGRIVEAGDAERRRIERNLHDGAQQHLLAIRLAVRVARKDAGDLEPQLAEIDAELGSALEELRALARGLHPPILSEAGLAPALETLARRAAIPVEIVAVPSARLPEAVETAAYYVAAEGVANALKHARPSHVRIEVSRTDGGAVVAVVDDGRGGATLQGSGLRGLRDRVEALDGSLAVESEPGRGTTLRAVFPCE
jgi:signal transduction histidine kinase